MIESNKLKKAILKLSLVIPLFLIVITLSGCREADEDLYVFIIAVDGMRADYFREVETPAMDYLLERGAVSYNHRVSVPSQTRVNFVTIPTGAHTDKHGVLGASYYDEDFNLIRTDSPDPISAQQNIPVPTIFEALEANGVKTAYLAMKGYELVGGRGASVLFGGSDYFPSYIWRSRYDDQIDGSEAESVNTKIMMNEFVLERMKEAVTDDGVRFFIANLGALDYIGHSHGLEDGYYEKGIIASDEQIQRFIDFLKEKDIFEKSVIIITADHGFTHILHPENVIMGSRFEPPVPELDSVGISHRALSRGGMSVELYIEDDERIQEAYNILRRIEWVSRIYSEHPLEDLDGTLSSLRYYFPGRSGDFFIDVLPTHTLNFPNRGQHGSTADSDMIVPLILSGKNILEGVRIESSEHVDIAPTALALFGLNHHRLIEADGRILTEALNKK